MKYNMDTLNTPKTDGITVSGDGIVISYANRSEERRVGKECRL